MMKFAAKREDILDALKVACGAASRRDTMPVLSHILVQVRGAEVTFTGTDLEVEMATTAAVESGETFDVTVPARKMLDICRNLPVGAKIEVALGDNRATVKSGRSRFVLTTLPAEDFPVVEFKPAGEITVTQVNLLTVVERTRFAMAANDVRYYLNGLMLEANKGTIRAVATDGHRLALAETEQGEAAGGDLRQVIIPRKGVEALKGLLTTTNSMVAVALSSNHVRVSVPGVRLISKLVDGRYPDYQRVIPQNEHVLTADTRELRAALTRAAVLAGEKHRGVVMTIAKNRLELSTGEGEETAQDEITVEYSGPEIRIGFNIDYVVEALESMGSEKVELRLKDCNTGCLMRPVGEGRHKSVIMPMRL